MNLGKKETHPTKNQTQIIDQRIKERTKFNWKEKKIEISLNLFGWLCKVKKTHPIEKGRDGRAMKRRMRYEDLGKRWRNVIMEDEQKQEMDKSGNNFRVFEKREKMRKLEG